MMEIMETLQRLVVHALRQNEADSTEALDELVRQVELVRKTIREREFEAGYLAPSIQATLELIKLCLPSVGNNNEYIDDIFLNLVFLELDLLARLVKQTGAYHLSVLESTDYADLAQRLQIAGQQKLLSLVRISLVSGKRAGRIFQKLFKLAKGQLLQANLVKELEAMIQEALDQAAATAKEA